LKLLPPPLALALVAFVGIRIVLTFLWLLMVLLPAMLLLPARLLLVVVAFPLLLLALLR
jgi:hypothetical protein